MDNIVLRRDGDVSIRRDRHGIPHIDADSETGLYYGVGYMQAIDRGLQLLLMRILGQGRASEILSGTPDMLALDIFFRQMNFSAANDELAKLDEEDRAILQAHCDGINAGLAWRMPWELRLVGYHKPEPWTIVDTLMMMRLIGYVGLSQGQGDIELFLVEMVQAGVDANRLRDFFTEDALGEFDLDLLRKVTLNRRIVPPEIRWNKIVPKAVASNNWVVSPSRTESGKAILCSDPHLEVNRLPNVWQEFVLTLNRPEGKRWAVGAGMPGIPGVIIGRTNTLAWGATYSFLDGLDLWVEHCKENTYLRDGEWKPFKIRKEIIRRKNGANEVVTFYENEHGVLDGEPKGEGYFLAAKWACTQGAGAQSIASIRKLFSAESLDQGMDALGSVETSWNWVLASEAGDIGYQMSGLCPRRRDGVTGLVPQAGWDSANDWLGFVHHAELPRCVNPPEGFFVTANNDLNAYGHVRPINTPMGSQRADRIANRLAANAAVTVDEMTALQHDVTSLQAEAYMKIVRPLLPDTHEGFVLREWDCRYDVASRGAWLFEQFYAALIQEVFGKKAFGVAVSNYLQHETAMLVGFYACFDRVLLAESSAWFSGEDRAKIYRRALEKALTAEGSTWGNQQQMTFTNIFFGGRLPRWLGFDRGPYALKGGRATPHQGQLFHALGRDSSFVGSLRVVADFAEDFVHMSLAGGPSDRRFSPWYASDILDWLNRKYKKVSPNRL